MKTLLIPIAALTLLSCDPVRRHQRLVERYPYVHTSEITTVHDTIEVIVPSVRVDTVTSVNFDTIVIERERLRVQLVRVRDSIFVDAECRTDTITVTRTIEVPTYISEKPLSKKRGWFRYFWLGVAGLWIFYLLFVRRNRN